jgi:sterol desaturase/sphingolipid hydroxylase (fatty acid hydroxylase superfamily)
MTTIGAVASWMAGSFISAEFLGYWLHRLLHSGAIGSLSRNHMRHHLVLYGPEEAQRSKEYRDATLHSFSLGNIGMEWLAPAGSLIVLAVITFYWIGVPVRYQCVYLMTTIVWSFLMFSSLHDWMHIEGFWLERNHFFSRWFLSARRRHDAHHQMINDRGLMDKNFGIGFFLFDRLFGTLSDAKVEFNQDGYLVAKKRFKSVLDAN